MDRQDKHREAKAKQREQKNKADKAYDAEAERRRPPVNALWLIVAGTALVAVIVYSWTTGFVRPW